MGFNLVTPSYVVPKGRIDSVKSAIRMAEEHFFPVVRDSVLDCHWRCGDEVHKTLLLADAKEWNREVDRIAKIKSGLLVHVFLKDSVKSVPFQVWIRLNGELRDYPRFNYPTEVRNKRDAFEFLASNNIHFCVMELARNVKQPQTIWIDSYKSIPEDDWLESSRRGNRLDRISLKASGQLCNFKKYTKSIFIDKLVDIVNQKLSKTYDKGV
jgi:hypothetical protein